MQLALSPDLHQITALAVMMLPQPETKAVPPTPVSSNDNSHNNSLATTSATLASRHSRNSSNVSSTGTCVRAVVCAWKLPFIVW
jgi:hypothetical protein